MSTKITRKEWLAAIGLAALTLAIYAQTAGFQFVNLDDDMFFYRNEHVLAGLTPASVQWALTSNFINWQPLAWLSHMAAVSLFGPSPGPHHVINAVLHAANAALLLLLLVRMTGLRWPSYLAAAVFAWHPLRVQSVAWVTERKDVLSGLFWLLTMWVYLDYVDRRRRFWWVAAMFALGLMAKPMLVTLPFALLLLDYWPLRRWPETGWRRLVWEKAPLMAMAAASSVITWMGQSANGAMGSVENYPPLLRMQNAAVAYVLYLRDLVWPASLAVLYPYPKGYAAWEAAGALAVLAGVTGLAVWKARQWPWLITGWLWYVGTLVPVIGLVQVGSQPRADRYTYLPLMMLGVALVWCAHTWLGESRLAALGGTACVILAWASYREASFWRDNVTLYTRAVAVNGGTHQVRNNLGGALVGLNRPAEAIPHLEAALAAQPEDVMARFNLGMALLATGQGAKALPHLAAAAEAFPDVSRAHYHYARALMQNGRALEAVAAYRRALALGVPDDFLPVFQKELEQAEAAVR